MYYLCIWDTRYIGNQHQKKDWTAQGVVIINHQNVTYQQRLVPVNNILLSPLHIKLGLLKNFIKALRNRGNERAIQRLVQIFPRLSQGKMKEGLLNGPDIQLNLREFLKKKRPMHDIIWKQCRWKYIFYNTIKTNSRDRCQVSRMNTLISQQI